MCPAAKAENAKKAALADRLQDLCRSLQAQNRAAKEEDAAKRKQMLDSFQASIEDIKSKCGGCLLSAHDTASALPFAAWPRLAYLGLMVDLMLVGLGRRAFSEGDGNSISRTGPVRGGRPDQARMACMQGGQQRGAER